MAEKEQDNFNNWYAKDYVYHHLGWIQTTMAEHVIQIYIDQKQAIPLDRLACIRNNKDIEKCWQEFSPQLKEALAQKVFLQEKICVSVAELTLAIRKLQLFTSLSLEERTKICDTMFTDVKSGFNEFHQEHFEHNLHVKKLGQRSAVWMILEMSCNNWSKWTRLLDKLYKIHTYCEVDECCDFVMENKDICTFHDTLENLHAISATACACKNA